MTVLHEALRYAERGLPVFPVRGKLPLTEHGFKNATTDADRIRASWSQWPEANVAIPTGPVSGLFVLDIDPRHGGNESLAALEAQHGPLPPTLEARSGGDGRHLYFALADGQEIRNSTGKLGPGLDMRGEGGYVVVPPSIHPVTQQPYRWTKKAKPASAPSWLLQALSAPAPVNESDPDAVIPDGRRNDTLARIAGAMRRKGCTQEAIEAALLAENAQRCSPSLQESEVRAIAQSISRYAPASSAQTLRPELREVERQTTVDSSTLPVFPEAAWRGIFSDYRKAMEHATEASDAFHFAALWARCTVALGRRVYFSLGQQVFPNVYLVCFGPTGDRKTTATRRGTELGSSFKIIRGGGSGEGLADEFSNAEPGEGFLLYAEEFSQVLRPGRWDGATLIPFLTQCFDCPEKYEMKYRKNPVSLERPTLSLLAGATPDWFWQDFRAKDFQGGFGNRLFFFTGRPKGDIPLPESPDMSGISRAVEALDAVEPCEARLEAKAVELWNEFYRAWRADESRRDALLLAAVRRIPAYVLKLAMVYAAAERTLPQITWEQLKAAVLVGRYGQACAAELLSLQNAGTNPRKELERRILTLVASQPGVMTTKREIYKRLWRHYTDAEAFNRAFDSLVRVGELFTKTAGHGKICVQTEPME